MAYRYKIRRQGEAQWGNRDHTLLGVTIVLRRRIRRSGADEVRQRWRGGDWGRWRGLREALQLFRHRLQGAGAGAVRQVQAGRDGPVWAVLKFERRPKIIDTQANSKIDRIYSWVVRTYSGVRNYGMCSRRTIDGTGTWSQHCPWPGPDPGSNAWDIGGPYALLLRVVPGLIEQGRLHEQTNGHQGLPVGKVIFNRRVWTPQDGSRPYNGSDPHLSHAHVEGRPERVGTPRAACP